MINNSLNINLNNVSNVNSQEDKKVKELRDKMMLIYTNIAKLFNDIKVTKSLINNHIVNENNYEEYLLMGKSSYNKITKIFELDDVYQNENIVFNDDSSFTIILTDGTEYTTEPLKGDIGITPNIRIGTI
jgi:hypothetical protein